MTNQTEPLQVEQRHRDAAGALTIWTNEQRKDVLAGKLDHNPNIQTFALFERDLRNSQGAKPVAYRYVHLDYAGRKVSRYGAHSARVNGHDPIEVHPLYEHPSTDHPRADERLREAAQHLLDIGEFCRTDDTESALRRLEAALAAIQGEGQP